jgi:hypothetical protein
VGGVFSAGDASEVNPYEGNGLWARFVMRFNCGIGELRFLLTFLPALVVLLFVLHELAAALVALAFTLLFLIIVAWRIVALLRARHMASYARIASRSDRSRSRRSGGAGGPSSLRLEQLMAGTGASATAVRLAMMERDFGANDYDLLMQLDEEHRRQSFTGLPQSSIDRLPTFKVPPAKEYDFCIAACHLTCTLSLPTHETHWLSN